MIEINGIEIVPLSDGILYRGDNMTLLRSFLDGSVDLVATDPPFNRNNKAFTGMTEDIWKWSDAGEQSKTLDCMRHEHPRSAAVIDIAWEAHGSDMAAFMVFMADRLLEIHRVLKSTGSIYLHCDDTASHYIKMLMDSIFGYNCFQNSIYWKRSTNHNNVNQKRYGRITDTILFYTMDRKYWTWNQQRKIPSGNTKRPYRHSDHMGEYESVSLYANESRRGESGQIWRGIDPTLINRHWSTPTQGDMNDFIIEHNIIPGWPDAYPGIHQRLDALDAAGMIYWPSKGNTPRLKYYVGDVTRGPLLGDVWDDISMPSGSKERIGYPTQKPVALYERMIAASSNPGDIVLDPFCGSGTTLVAATPSADDSSVSISAATP